MAKIIAHRGFCAEYPENTLLAFGKALEAGCDGIELDVHLSRDGRLAVIHDETIDRTTNGTGAVQEKTLEELQRFDAGSGEHIPSLEEYFDLIQNTEILTNIELKNSIIWYEGMEEKVVRLVRERELSGRILFSSFNHYSLLKCKELAPEIPCGLLCGSWIVNAGAYARSLGMECLHPHFYNLTDEIVREMKEHGRIINTWTVNDAADFIRLEGMGVDSIITNNPLIVRR